MGLFGLEHGDHAVWNNEKTSAINSKTEKI